MHVCVLSACVVEHFVGDLCSRFKPLSTLHLCSSLSLPLSLFVFPSLSHPHSLFLFEWSNRDTEAPFLIGIRCSFSYFLLYIPVQEPACSVIDQVLLYAFGKFC